MTIINAKLLRARNYRGKFYLAPLPALHSPREEERFHLARCLARDRYRDARDKQTEPIPRLF